MRAWDDGNAGGGGPSDAVLDTLGGRPDDVGFIRRVIATISATIAELATHRVYLTGRGAGCSMALRFAVEASTQVAAVACASGYLVHQQSIVPVWLQSLSGSAPPPYSALPVMLTYAQDDAADPRLVRDNFERWAARNQCTGASQEQALMPGVAREVCARCRSSTEVLMISLGGGAPPCADEHATCAQWAAAGKKCSAFYRVKYGLKTRCVDRKRVFGFAFLGKKNTNAQTGENDGNPCGPSNWKGTYFACDGHAVSDVVKAAKKKGTPPAAAAQTRPREQAWDGCDHDTEFP